MEPNKRLPLFIVSGASGVGKTSACEVLFKKEKDYIVLDSDILWQEVFDTPQDNYRNFREVWLNMCAGISQIGLPVVLCGCGVPEQFECCEARKYFSQIHYLAIVSRGEVLEERMRTGRQIEDAAWLKSSADFNEWLRLNGKDTTPPIEILDNSELTAEQTAERIDGWIRCYSLRPQ